MSDRVSSKAPDASPEEAGSPPIVKRDKKKKQYERVSSPSGSSHGTGRVRKVGKGTDAKEMNMMLEALKTGDESALHPEESAPDLAHESEPVAPAATASVMDALSAASAASLSVSIAENTAASTESTPTGSPQVSASLNATMRASGERPGPSSGSSRPTSTVRPGPNPMSPRNRDRSASIAQYGSALMRQQSIHTLRPKKGQNSRDHVEAAAAAAEAAENAENNKPVSAAVAPAANPQNLLAAAKAAETALKEVSYVLECAGINEQDVWEGSIEVFPILKHFSVQVEAASMTFPDTIVNFIFPKQPEFKGTPSKTYKIDRHWTISQIISMICKRMDISTPKKTYHITTLRGFEFNENDTLASFGLGSLLPNWQLKIVKKQSRGLTRISTLSKFDAKTGLGRRDEDEGAPLEGYNATHEESPASEEPAAKPAAEADRKKGKRLKKSSTESAAEKKTESAEAPSTTTTAAEEPAASPALAEERYPVLFIFESLEFPFKTQRVMLRPTMTVSSVIESLCRAYHVPNPWRFQLQTLSKLALNPDTFLNDYGLGHRFQRWQVRLAVKTDASSASTAILEAPSSKHAWVQFSESNLQIEEARRIILELDAKVERMKKRAEAELHSKVTVPSVTESALAAVLGGLAHTAAPAAASPEEAPAATPRSKEKKSSRSEREKLRKEILQLKNQLKNLESENQQLKGDLAVEKSRAQKEMEQVKTGHAKVALELDSARTVRVKEKEMYEKKIKALEGNINETLRMVGSSSAHVRKGSIFDVFGGQPESKGQKEAEPAEEPTPAPAEDAPSATIQLKLSLDKAKLDLENFKLELDQVKATHAAELQASQAEATLYSNKMNQALEEQQVLHTKFEALTLETESLKKAHEELTASLESRDQRIAEQQKQLEQLHDTLKASEEEITDRVKSQLKKQFDLDYMTVLETNRELTEQLAEANEELDSLRMAIQELLQKEQEEEVDEEAAAEEAPVEGPAEIPAAPAPPPPPAPPAPPAPVLPRAASRVVVVSIDEPLHEVGQAQVSVAEEAAPEQASGVSLMDEMMAARTKLKKAGPTPIRRDYHSDLQIALQKRFVAMNLDDFVEDLEEDEDLNDGFDDDFEDSDDSDTESTSSSVSDHASERDDILFSMKI